jgi:hypothetical protein
VTEESRGWSEAETVEMMTDYESTKMRNGGRDLRQWKVKDYKEPRMELARCEDLSRTTDSFHWKTSRELSKVKS